MVLPVQDSATKQNGFAWPGGGWKKPQQTPNVNWPWGRTVQLAFLMGPVRYDCAIWWTGGQGNPGPIWRKHCTPREKTHPKEGFLSLIPSTFWTREFPVVEGAVLCIAGCLAASLASTYWTSAAPPSPHLCWDNQKHLQLFPKVPGWRVQNRPPGQNHCLKEESGSVKYWHCQRGA